MAGFNKFKLTENGAELLNDVLANHKILEFTRFEIGSGKVEDAKNATSLSESFLAFPVNYTGVLKGGYTNIKGFFDNSNLFQERVISEIGIFAKIEGGVQEDILFSYSTSINDGEVIPSRNTYFSRTISATSRTDDAENVMFNCVLDKNRYVFNTLAELKSAGYLDVGDKVELWGMLELGDMKKTSKIITETPSEIELVNGLYASRYSDFLETVTYKGTADDLKKEIDDIALYVSKGTYTDDSIGADYAGDFYLTKRKGDDF